MSDANSTIHVETTGHDFTKLAKEYMENLLQGNRNQAIDCIMTNVSNGLSVKELYLNVLQPVQYEIGRLWQNNRASVAMEHFFTATTQLVMAQLFPYVMSSKKNGNVFVACCVEGELHELGMRMVADFFEMEGYDTYYLGANTPPDGITDIVVKQNAAILGISVTMLYNVGKASKIIETVKKSSEFKEVKIMVGGFPFMLNPNLYKNVGADISANDASQAVKLARNLISTA